MEIVVAKKKQCWLCSTEQERLRKLPNGVFICDPCYEERNPLFKLGESWHIWKNRATLYRRSRKEIEKIGKPNIRMDQANKLINRMEAAKKQDRG